jgi:hypothetical protein
MGYSATLKKTNAMFATMPTIQPNKTAVISRIVCTPSIYIVSDQFYG